MEGWTPSITELYAHKPGYGDGGTLKKHETVMHAVGMPPLSVTKEEEHHVHLPSTFIE